nr:MAG TPA: hypothetical protein [Caudoviricetes sp.]DAP28319.1 MAG TPA: hypothetical protein [Bacteriophage sp.]
MGSDPQAQDRRPAAWGHRQRPGLQRRGPEARHEV